MGLPVGGNRRWPTGGSGGGGGVTRMVIKYYRSVFSRFALARFPNHRFGSAGWGSGKRSF